MDISIVIISAIIIALCLLPVVIFRAKQKKNKQHFKNILSEIANTKGLKIKTCELATPIAIGLTDNDEAFVYYHKHENGSEEQACILLSEIKRCNLNKINRESGSGNIGKLIMTFESYDKSKPEISLNFFDASETFLLRGELELAEKWKLLIDEAVGSKQISAEAVKTPKTKEYAVAAKIG